MDSSDPDFMRVSVLFRETTALPRLLQSRAEGTPQQTGTTAVQTCDMGLYTGQTGCSAVQSRR